MSVSYFVRYDIRAGDVDGFVHYYRTRHVAVLSTWRGLKRVILHTPLDWQDSAPVNRGNAVLLAQLEFESAQALNDALAARERGDARRDFERFPPFEGTV